MYKIARTFATKLLETSTYERWGPPGTTPQGPAATKLSELPGAMRVDGIHHVRDLKLHATTLAERLEAKL